MIRTIAIAAGMAFAFAAPSFAITQIVSPTDDYRTNTSLIGVPDNGLERNAWGDMALTVNFSSPLAPRTVGVNWATWGSPPETEQAAPRIWYSQGENDVTFTFSQALNIWGFEAQPNDFDVFDITVEFYDGAVLLGSIVRAVDGNSGARLFAAAADFGEQFTSVRIRTDGDFAVAQLRYGLAVIPEPATWGMLIAGFGMVGFAMRRRRAIGAINA